MSAASHPHHGEDLHDQDKSVTIRGPFHLYAANNAFMFGVRTRHQLRVDLSHLKPIMPAAKKNVPNFFIVGAPKAGTDSLYYDLDQHPDIYMSPLKEPCYFSSEIRIQNFGPEIRAQMEVAIESTRQYLQSDMRQKRFGGLVSEWKDYLQLFSGVKEETAIGEGSVCYLWSPSAPKAIASAIPSAKIIIVLMDPAERAFHQYLKSVADGSVGHSFLRHIQMSMEHAGDVLGIFHPFLEFGSYAEQVQRYFDAFPAEQLHISLYEEMKANYTPWLADILKFLNVSMDFIPDPSKRRPVPPVPKLVGASHSLQRNPLWKSLLTITPSPIKKAVKSLAYRQAAHSSMNREERLLLIDYYRKDIQKLESYLHRDLSAWLR